jgi:ribosomal protein S18 acetylase RimI-like enzyme
MRSLYAQYLSEREGREIVETPLGFATYHIQGPDVYIVDIYVIPECRTKGIAAEMADEIAKRARAKGCTTMFGTVVPSVAGSTASLKVLLAYGFSLASSTNDFIVMKKGI